MPATNIPATSKNVDRNGWGILAYQPTQII